MHSITKSVAVTQLAQQIFLQDLTNEAYVKSTTVETIVEEAFYVADIFFDTAAEYAKGGIKAVAAKAAEEDATCEACEGCSGCDEGKTDENPLKHNFAGTTPMQLLAMLEKLNGPAPDSVKAIFANAEEMQSEISNKTKLTMEALMSLANAQLEAKGK